MKYYSKMLDWLLLVFKWLIIASMFIFTAVVIASVFFRYVLGNSLTWSEQLARFLFVWVIMMGVPIAYRTNLIAVLDLLTDRFPEPIKSIVAIIMDVLIALFAAYYAYGGLSYVLRAGKNIFQGLNIPAGWIYASEVVCGAALFLVALEFIVNRTIKLVKKEG